MRVEELPASIVIDASVGLKWVVDETGSDIAAALVGGRLLVVPSLFWIETANALATKARRQELDVAAVADAWSDLSRAPLEVVALDRGRITDALRLAQDLGHAVYDCCYLEVALARGTIVVTADRRFFRAVGAKPTFASQIVLLSDLCS